MLPAHAEREDGRAGRASETDQVAWTLQDPDPEKGHGIEIPVDPRLFPRFPGRSIERGLTSLQVTLGQGPSS
jgi:hypothetical protein